jgi:hypothetical protein
VRSVGEQRALQQLRAYGVKRVDFWRAMPCLFDGISKICRTGEGKKPPPYVKPPCVSG